MSLSPDPTPWGTLPQNLPPAPHWGGPAWGARPPYGFGATSPSRSYSSDRSHVLPAFVLAAVIAAVVLGGIALDGVMAAPSAGTVVIGGSVSITAAPGWVLSPDAAGTPDVIELRTADAILDAQVVLGFHEDLTSLLDSVESQLRADAAQVSFGDTHTTSIGGHKTMYATFEATVSSSAGSGVIDGEIVAVDVEGTVVVVEVATPQGRFDYIAGDVTAMLESLRPVT